MIRPSLLALTLGMIGTACAGAPKLAQPVPTASVQDRGATLYQRAETLARQGDLIRAEQYALSAVSAGYPEERALPLLLSVCLASSRLRAALRHVDHHLMRHPANPALSRLSDTLHAALEQPAAMTPPAKEAL